MAQTPNTTPPTTSRPSLICSPLLIVPDLLHHLRAVTTVDTTVIRASAWKASQGSGRPTISGPGGNHSGAPKRYTGKTRVVMRPALATRRADQPTAGARLRPLIRRTTATSGYPANASTNKMIAASSAPTDSYHARGASAWLCRSCCGADSTNAPGGRSAATAPTKSATRSA